MSEQPPQPPEQAEIFDNLAQIFGGFFGGAPPTGDISLELAVTEAEAAAGARRTVTYQRHAACASCAGHGSADPAAERVPCGTCQGTGQRVAAQGFFAVASPCPTCRGARAAFANPCAACAGAGTRAEPAEREIDVPAHAHDGDRVRVEGAGSARPGQAAPGDLFVVLRVGPRAADAADLPAARVTSLAGRPARLPAAQVAAGVAFLAALLYLLYRL